MIEWLRRNSPGFLGHKDLHEAEENAETASSWLEAFKSHWAQAYTIIKNQYQDDNESPDEAYETSSNNTDHLTEVNGEEHHRKKPTDVVQPDQIMTVFSHLDQMVQLLLAEISHTTQGQTIGPILDEMFTVGMLDKVVCWGLSVGPPTPTCQVLLLKLYESLISQAQLAASSSTQSILVHKPILIPLLKLLEACSKSSPGSVELEKRLVILLNQVCVSIARDASILEFFFNQATADDLPKFTVFTLLVPFLYREGDIGQFARDSVLLILSASRKSESVGRFIAEHSNFCPVLATGLSGLYSMLPRKLSRFSDDWHCIIPMDIDMVLATGLSGLYSMLPRKLSRFSDDWHCITPMDIEMVPELKSFHSTLEFCNAVVQVAHPSVQERLLDYIYQGFLVPVVGSALNQPSLEEIVTSTAYLEMFFTSVTEPALVRVLVRFLLVADDNESVPLLESLVTRISSNSRLCLVSLSLFNTLLDLNCEDLMYELVLKYLIPCTHVMVSQTKSIRMLDIYSRSSEKFLSLIPNCCNFANSNKLSSNAGSNSTDERQRKTNHSPGYNGDPFGQSDGPDPSDESYARENDATLGQPLDSETVRRNFLASFDRYLRDARVNIQTCYRACLRWSMPYDGLIPDPHLFRDEVELGPAAAHLAINLSDDGAGSGTESTGSGRFYRNSALRQSAMSVISNSYFSNHRLSSLYGYSQQFGAPHGISSLELTLGQEEFFIALDGLEPLELNSHGGPKGSEGGSSSTLSTPVKTHRPGELPPPKDYMKLTYDEDSHVFSAGEEYESDFPGYYGGGPGSAGSQGVNPFVLVGWSKVEDQEAFVELLARVRSSSVLNGVVTQAHMDFIDEKFAATTAEPNLEHAPDASRNHSDDSCPSDSDKGNADGMEDEASLLPPVPVISPAVFKGKFSSPNIGPFLSVLLHKAEHMVTNSLFVNLQLTGLLTRLAVYPQPLVTSFLLNDQLVFQPSVRSLFQILGTVKHKVDSWALSVENWADLLVKGREYLEQRQSKHEEHLAGVKTGKTINEMQNKAKAIGKLRSRSFMTGGANRITGQTLVLKSRSGSLEQMDAGYRYIHRASTTDASRSALDLIKTKNVVYCAIVLEEFVKELAAICQEHPLSARLDLTPTQFV